MGGVPLDDYAVQAAVMGTLEKMERVGLLGEEEFKGLLNLPTTGRYAVTLTTQANNSTFS